MVAEVYFKDRFVEVPDTTYQLKDIVAALGLDASCVVIRFRSGARRVAASLPFECLPDCSEGACYEVEVLEDEAPSSIETPSMIDVQKATCTSADGAVASTESASPPAALSDPLMELSYDISTTAASSWMSGVYGRGMYNPMRPQSTTCGTGSEPYVTRSDPYTTAILFPTVARSQ